MAVADDATPPPAKLSISGAALAALLHRCASATGDCDGLLSGHATLLPAPPPSLSDHDHTPSSSPPAPALSISVSGHSSLSHPSSLSDPLGRFRPPSSPASAAVGFFSSRRRSPLRPSMREVALAHSLSKALPLAHEHPLLFLLVSPSTSPNLAVHSYDYRAFLLVGSARLVPASLHVVNVGPAFPKDQYHSFSPASPMPSPMPWLPESPAAAAEGGCGIGEQQVVDDGFEVGRMGGVLGSAAALTGEMDEMYAGMLRRLEKLAAEVEKSDHRVLRQVVLLNVVHRVVPCTMLLRVIG